MYAVIINSEATAKVVPDFLFLLAPEIRVSAVGLHTYVVGGALAVGGEVVGVSLSRSAAPSAVRKLLCVRERGTARSPSLRLLVRSGEPEITFTCLLGSGLKGNETKVTEQTPTENGSCVARHCSF